MKHKNGVIDENPAVMALAQNVSEVGVSVEILHIECHYESCLCGGRVVGKSDTSRRTDLEKDLEDVGTVRTYKQK